MNIDQARKYLKQYHKPEYIRYIETTLAGDFAVVLAEDHERILHQLNAELKWRNDNSNN